VHSLSSQAREGQRGARPVAGRARERALWIGGTVAAAAVLMFCYLRTAGTVPVLSDGAGNALQAWDMLHGNVLLHGWWVTDVSFYTTELPQYILVEAAAGLRPEVVHICAAMTYTLLVLLAAFVARGRATGAEGIVRVLLAAGIMLAPEPAAPTWVLMSSPDHVGTAVPVLVLLLVLDWAFAAEARHRWYVPVVCGIVLAWTIVGDEIAIVIGSVPLAVACLIRAARAWWPARGSGQAARPGAGERLRGTWFEISLAAAAVLAIPVALAAERVLRHLGGFRVNPGVSAIVPVSVMSKNFGLAVQSVLAIFGADWEAVHGRLNVTFAIVHLAGVLLVLAAVVWAVWRLLRALGPRRGDLLTGDARTGDLVADFLVIAVVVNVLAYFGAFRITNIYAAHEIGAVLPLGAALAGRAFGGPLLRARLGRPSRQARPAGTAGKGVRVLVPVLAVGLACYAAMLGWAATRDQAPPQNATLSSWLTGHGLRSGLAGYWQGTSVTLDSGGRIDMVSVVPVKGGRLAPRHWEADMRLTDSSTHSANFVVVVPGGTITGGQAITSFGKPATVYRYQGYTIMVWRQNLLRRLAPSVN
jgi:hypothetical protein